MAFVEKSSNADQYSSLATPQFNGGCSFVDSLGLKPGDKILDMGCGTGEITRYIAEKVGKNGEVVGVDPDEERIKVARLNIASFPNVTVEVGDSGSAFPNANEAYYDVHFSNYVFHWLDFKERQIFVKKAFDCLKPEGLLAIRCITKTDESLFFQIMNSSKYSGPSWVDQRSVEELLSSCGFPNVDTKVVQSCHYHKSFDEFIAWFLTSTHSDLRRLPNEILEEVKKRIVESDGRAKSTMSVLLIQGRKNPPSI